MKVEVEIKCSMVVVDKIDSDVRTKYLISNIFNYRFSFLPVEVSLVVSVERFDVVLAVLVA